MISRTQVLDLFLETTDILVEDFDLVDFLHTLAGNAASAGDAASAGVVVTDPMDRLRYVASSSEHERVLKLLELQEGPSLDVIMSGLAVVNVDLSSVDDRWPLFAPAARDAGYQSVHVFPLKARRRTIGALNVLSVDAVRRDPDELRVVQGLADLAAIAIIQERSGDRAQTVVDRLQSALSSRIVIEQAKGALSRSQSISLSDAFDVMRTTARSIGVKVDDIARAVIAELEVPAR